MKIPTTILVAWFGSVLVSAAGGGAEVRPLEFLHALQEKGYSEVAIEYLNMLKKQPGLAPEVEAVWDLEMSKSLRAEANRVRDYNPKDFESLMDEAQKHLDQFLKNHPTHPEAATAMVSWGMFSMDRALASVRAAKGVADPAEKAKHQTAARTRLQEARSRLLQAAETLQKRLAETPLPELKPGRRPDREAQAALERRDQIEQNLVNARFQAALADYYVAQTYDDPNAEPRKKALQSAAQQMDAIYQANRMTSLGQVNVTGLYAHMWHGKIADELGDVQLARDIYEEVLANEPGPKVVDRVLDPLFAQVQYYYFAIMARQDPAAFLDEATRWLRDYDSKCRRTEGYQGIALLVAKIKLDAASRAKGAEKNKLVAEANAILNEMIKVPSPYRQEALQLRRQHAKVAPGSIRDAKTFDEAEALAQSAAAAEQWDEAAQGFQQALEFSKSIKDEKRIQEVRDGLAYAKYMMAVKLFQANKLEECLASLSKIMEEHQASPAGALAASLAVETALRTYVAANPNQTDQRQQALDRLEKVAQKVEATWAGKPAADDARMALAQANLVRGRIAEAIDVFEKVAPRSERYPVALYLAARTYFDLYLQEKRKGEAGNAEKAKADRDRALQRATESLDRFRKAAEPNQPLSPQHIECQLFVAVMHLEAKEFAQAAALVQPLVDQIQAAKPRSLDDTTVRIFRAALQAYIALGDVSKASGVASALADLGADDPAVNALLVGFATQLDQHRKEAEAELTRATAAGDQQATEAANAKLKSAQTQIGTLLKKLASRKEYAVPGLVALGDLCKAMGMSNEAKQLYQKVLDTPEADPRAVTRARAQLVGLLRQAGDFEQAVAEAQKLAAAHSRALEAQMELARCLKARAEKDPARYDEAIAQWTKIRNMLQPIRKKPPEYYEVIYESAWCLYAQAYQTGEKIPERVGEAIKLLKSAKVLNEKLSGPDMVAKYDALLDALEKYLSQAGAGSGTESAK